MAGLGLEALARRYLRAMDGIQVEPMVALYDPSGTLSYPGVLEPVGRDGIRNLLEAVVRNMRANGLGDVRFTMENLAVSGRTTFLEWSSVTESPRGPIRNRGVQVITWSPEGRILRSQGYARQEAVRRYTVGRALAEAAPRP